jgi:HNH endonuclease
MSTSYISASLRREVEEQAGRCCEYCRLGQEDRAIDFVIDHIIAEKHGGATTVNNLCLSCYWCNSYKGSDISSVDWDMDAEIVPLYNPRRQKWTDHFQLEGTYIKPLTPHGRVTVFLLKLNASQQITERELLLTLGVYPCQSSG